MIRITPLPFDPAAELSGFCADDISAGAIASFIGKVRGTDDELPLISLTLEHYPGMAEAKLGELIAEAGKRWPLRDVLVIHRVGRMVPGDAIVLVATASSHRQAALAACQFIIDWLKVEAPFWKFEETAEGGEWVDPRSSDEEAAGRWV
jgi:molybdopterin synthase catalytic subunit